MEVRFSLPDLSLLDQHFRQNGLKSLFLSHFSIVTDPHFQLKFIFNQNLVISINDLRRLCDFRLSHMNEIEPLKEFEFFEEFVQLVIGFVSHFSLISMATKSKTK